jgi:preprotein translocase subunit SecE
VRDDDGRGRQVADSKESSDAVSGFEPDTEPAQDATSSKSGKSAKRRWGNPFARLGRFTREVVAELRKVIYPTRNELVTYTIVVIVFVTIMVSIVGALDLGFAKGITYVFGTTKK